MQTSSADNPGARFSAVIVNYNGGNMLADSIRSAVEEGIAPEQIIIVDNGSRDDSIARIQMEFPFVPILHNGCNAGFSRAMNRGLAQATAEFILLLNNDAQLQPGALRAFSEAFDSIPRLTIAGGQLRYPDGRLQSAISRVPTLISELLPHTLLEWIFPNQFRGTSSKGEPVAVEGVVGACIAVRTASLPMLGLLDEDYFFFYEETEWCLRAWRLGFEVYHLPAARVLHLQGGTAKRFRGLARLEFQRSKLIFFKKTRSRFAYYCASMLVTLATVVDAVVNTVLCAVTCFLIKRLRIKTCVYLYLLTWHLLGRPDSWGLPDKCVHRVSECTPSSMSPG
jgi:N-acetylglucosaminyl-diphospho-decaprenol L-rhamnosyltransferase